jgi:hypothetical protein
MDEYVENIYEKFNEHRKQYELQQADDQDIQELRMLEHNIKIQRSNNKK